MLYARSVHLLAVGATFAACIATAVAQDATDTIMRAAYCAGVLKESARHLHEIAARARSEVSTCPTYSAQSHLWESMKARPEDCGTRMAIAIDAGRIFAEEQDARRKRYAQYLALRLGDMSGGQKTAVMALHVKGEGDAAAQVKAADHPGVARCIELKHSTTAALVDCIAQHNQTYASIVRCQQMPDQLPF